MKKLGLLIVGAFLLVACDATPGGNKAILPVVHDGNKEVVEDQNEAAKEEVTPAENIEATEINVEEENAATRKLEEDRATEEAQAAE